MRKAIGVCGKKLNWIRKFIKTGTLFHGVVYSCEKPREMAVLIGFLRCHRKYIVCASSV